ncbi:MAG: Maff2 family protein [Alistipes sp.]|nr:Maff2 family protein [Alistipes sp.]
MSFFTDAVGVLQTVLTLIGAGLGGWGIVNLLEAYGSDNAGGKSQGMKQLMGGGGIILLAQILIPKLNGLMSTS